jgi:hypothetical protein
MLDVVIPAYSELLVHDATEETECMSHLTAAPDGLAALFASREGKVKLLHQFHHDLRTPLVRSGTNEMWGLAGTGSRAAPVLIPMTAFQAMEGFTPTFEQMCDIKDQETLDAATVPTGAVTRHNSAQLFHDGSSRRSGLCSKYLRDAVSSGQWWDQTRKQTPGGPDTCS